MPAHRVAPAQGAAPAGRQTCRCWPARGCPAARTTACLALEERGRGVGLRKAAEAACIQRDVCQLVGGERDGGGDAHLRVYDSRGAAGRAWRAPRFVAALPLEAWLLVCSCRPAPHPKHMPLPAAHPVDVDASWRLVLGDRHRHRAAVAELHQRLCVCVCEGRCKEGVRCRCRWDGRLTWRRRRSAPPASVGGGLAGTERAGRLFELQAQHVQPRPLPPALPPTQAATHPPGSRPCQTCSPPPPPRAGCP